MKEYRATYIPDIIDKKWYTETSARGLTIARCDARCIRVVYLPYEGLTTFTTRYNTGYSKGDTSSLYYGAIEHDNADMGNMNAVTNLDVIEMCVRLNKDGYISVPKYILVWMNGNKPAHRKEGYSRMVVVEHLRQLGK